MKLLPSSYCLLFFCFLCSAFDAGAQKRSGTVSGRVINEEDKPLTHATIQVLNTTANTFTNDSGFFSITVPADKPVAIIFSFTGYNSVQKNFYLHGDEKENVVIKLTPVTKQLNDVLVKDDKDRKQDGLINIDASKALLNPSPISGIESLIKVFVGSNNELTSQYTVRGGGYDENLAYVNDFEIYRPYLVSSGQQEGLSFINPELTGNVKFYNGGFQAKYGDKMSSALDVTYRKPTRNGGSAYIGLLEQGLHLEGIAANSKVTYLIGVRNRNNRNLLSTQSTKGNYIPASNDQQGLITWQASPKLRLEALGNLSQTKFTLIPEQSQLTSSVFSPLFSGSIGLDIFFEGREKSRYSTNFIGLTAIHQPKKNLQLKWMISYFKDHEEENRDIGGTYLFGERSFDENSSSYGLIVNPYGSGFNQNYARNELDIAVLNAAHKGSLSVRHHFFQWGNTIEQQKISDGIHEWEYRDSAGYSLPYDPSQQGVYSYANADANIDVTRFSGYIQDNIQLKDSSGFTLQAGVRYNYNTLNKELLISPRIGFSFKPKNWEKDIIFRAAAGIYDQPPFYREMRRYDGSLNTSLKAQKSWQLSGGFDYNFTWLGRPARLATEVYYKNMTDIVPYDVENVHIQYFGENMATAYAAGIEARLFGELVKDAESWLSIGIMRTREDLSNDFFTQYYNAAGEEIGQNTPDKIPTDSITASIGYLRRPTDRLVTFGMFFQDYLSTNKNFKVYFSTLYGSNLPYNIPGSTRYRNALVIDPYLRVDIGFSALLLDSEKSNRRSRNPFYGFENIWASLEIFNVIDRLNTISYELVKDFDNNTYTLPNRLTPRLVNFKIIARW